MATTAPPNAFGNALGNAIVSGIQTGRSKPAPSQAQAAAQNPFGLDAMLDKYAGMPMAEPALGPVSNPFGLDAMLNRYATPSAAKVVGPVSNPFGLDAMLGKYAGLDFSAVRGAGGRSGVVLPMGAMPAEMSLTERLGINFAGGSCSIEDGMSLQPRSMPQMMARDFAAERRAQAIAAAVASGAANPAAAGAGLIAAGADVEARARAMIATGDVTQPLFDVAVGRSISSPERSAARKAPSGVGVSLAESYGRASPGDFGVAVFGPSNVGYYTREAATIGAKGRSFFFMPLEDSALIRNAADAARYTGRAQSAEEAFLNGRDIYGLSFPSRNTVVSRPTAVDAGGWDHFLEGGHTAVRLGTGPTAGYLVNPTREFVMPGGHGVPAGSVLFRIGPHGEWIPVRRF